jgi:sterol desaturase/sphingolipid hydroxylase (fatty acid hydroxylase superfamily)
MLDVAATFVATYYAASIIQVVAHRLFGHVDRVRPVFESHALGHHGVYPRDNLLSDHWVPAEKHVMWYFVPLFAPMVFAMYAFTSFTVFVTHVSGIAFAVWWHVFLHQQYHLRGSFLERFGWFQRKRELHFVHHRRVHRNYAIVEFWLDHVLGTIEKPNPTPHSDAHESWRQSERLPVRAGGRER